MLTREAIDALLEHDWPGNVRELANVMEHAYILAGGQPIAPEHLPYSVLSQPATRPVSATASVSAEEPATPRTLREIEMDHILLVLEKHKGRKVSAAEELGISLKTLYNKLALLEEERKAAG